MQHFQVNRLYLNPVSAKYPENVILKTKEKARTSRISLSTTSTAQLYSMTFTNSVKDRQRIVP